MYMIPALNCVFGQLVWLETMLKVQPCSIWIPVRSLELNDKSITDIWFISKTYQTLNTHFDVFTDIFESKMSIWKHVGQFVDLHPA
jgi:hypothetical protein